ncbi:MAG: prephenate dehydrogenase/arogenate dehydrogenase family protein [Desulfuromonadaceae bacterium]|nr:prephenate dehydrogenase/arogenate dehydrogenase family protein [Desulfuromonadaceae bacterium]
MNATHSTDGFFLSRLCVIGVGLIGGSLALALKRSGCVGRVIGWDADGDNLMRAKQLGIVDEVAGSCRDAVADADVVVLAVPVRRMAEVAASVLPVMKSTAILTDTGSVKGTVVEAIEPLAEAARRWFVAGHPISGTEKSGAEAAFAELYRSKRCILTPTQGTNPQALEVITRLWQMAGSDVVLMDVVKHDRILAAISHLPHMIAYALVNSVSSYDQYPENILEYSAGGFRDFTRIASSDPVMWRDIALDNRDALLEMIEQFEAFLAELKDDIRQRKSEQLEAFFLNSKLSRDAILTPR